MAMMRSTDSCLARYTTPVPPSPMRSRISKRSASVLPTSGSGPAIVSSATCSSVIATRLFLPSECNDAAPTHLLASMTLTTLEGAAVERILAARALQHRARVARLDAGRRSLVDVHHERAALAERRHHARLDALARRLLARLARLARRVLRRLRPLLGGGGGSSRGGGGATATARRLLPLRFHRVDRAVGLRRRGHADVVGAGLVDLREQLLLLLALAAHRRRRDLRAEGVEDVDVDVAVGVVPVDERGQHAAAGP